GRVVFISSVNGQISVPLLGAYCASKFALEAAADALRMELQPWHIDVSVVEPAQTATDMWETEPAQTATDMWETAPEQRVLYAKHVAGFRKMIPLSQRVAVQPQTVAEVVEEALTAKRPNARYTMGLVPSLQLAVMMGLVPSLQLAVM
ncbi:SDR family NAD(P)-dependent oxidoreductase, partial [Mycolicibacterium sphagni]|uniref:SDR family NAD(P)-dependent oxidoreductase n=1 Tax=Mycolicibacterium sphagni TaxID=1786 RepID=UPI0021F287E2